MAIDLASWREPLLDILLPALAALQQGLLSALHALGLAPVLHGQPAWPFERRVSAAMLTIDAGHARQVAWVLALLALAGLGGAVSAVLALPCWRWPRAVAAALGLALAAGAGALAAWPDPALLWAPATPTSWHRLPPAAAQAGALQGEALYARHCLACHGAQGDGDGPRAQAEAAAGRRWPPTLNRGLLWQRSDGELFWHIRHGMVDADGRRRMPGLPGGEPDEAVWQLIAWLQWRAAGQQLARAGEWQLPVAAPALSVRCDGGPPRPLAALRGQRLRLVALAPGQAPLPEDPRFQTVTLRPLAAGAAVAAGGCQAESAAAWQAYALIAGVPAQALAGTEFLLDRGGWLRARRRAGDPPWSEAMLVCRSNNPAEAGARAAAQALADPLDRLLARLDAEPVRAVRGGRLH